MKVRAIRTLGELEGVRGSWEQWQTHVNSDLAQFALVCSLRPEVESPFVVVVEQAGMASALVMGRLERTVIAPTVGYIAPVRMRARVLAVMHQGVIGHLDEHAATAVVRFLWSVLESGGADAINFHHLPEGSPLLGALLREGPRWLCEKSPRWSTHREMNVPAQGSLLETKVAAKHRSRLRKRQSALEAAYPGLCWRWLRDVRQVPDLCARLEQVAAKTYQRGLGAGYFDSEEFRQRFALFASRDQLRVQTLEIDGTIRAFWFGTVYSGVFHSSETGYDPQLRAYEVGTLMFARLVDELTREGIDRLDFGIGDAHYKERFGDRSWRETSAWMVAPHARGVAVMLLLRASMAADRAMRGFARRFGLTDRIKRVWRRHTEKVGPPSGTAGAVMTPAPSHHGHAKDVQ